MSLVSPLERKNTQAIDDAVNVTSSSTSTSTASYLVPNVYQVEGKPLSREALYKAKLKYGFYQSPAAKTGTGVVDSKQSSNKAASLAATSLSEKERVKQEELNKRLTPEQQYKRLLVGPDASKIAALHSQASESAATTTTTTTSTTSTTSTSTIFDNESLKKAARKATRGSVTKELPTKINKGELNISKVLVGAEKNASERLASFSGNTKEDVTTAAFNKGQLNISKVLVGAEKRANERINNASGGVKNQVYNYYINTPVELQQNKEEFRHKILGKGTPELYAGANKAAVDAVENFSEGYQYHISEKNEKFASNAAGNALEQSNQRALAEKARNDIYLNATTHEKVLQLARESVLKQMNELEFEATTKRDPGHILFNNDQFNRAAVDYVLKKHDAKMQKEQFLKGKVDVGGGLLLTQVELDEIAKKLVDPYLTEISDKASKQRERDIVILNEFQHNKETTKTFKETRREQQDREKARTEFERKHKKEESKLNKHLVNIEQTGALINVPDLLAQIKGHNEEINNILQDDEVLNGKIDSFKQDIESHESKIGELGQELESKRNERKTLASAVSDVSGVSAEDSETPTNKYDIQSLDNDIVLKEARESKEKALLLIKQKNLENHVKDLELNDKVKETLQKQIDLKLAKLETLKGLGTESKDKYNALDKLREENKINLTSRHLYIRSTFGKDLDAMIKEEQEKYEREEAEKAAEKAAERAAKKAAAAPLSPSEETVPEAEEGLEKEVEEGEGEGEGEEEVKSPEATELHGSVVPAEEHIEVHPAVEEAAADEAVEEAADEAVPEVPEEKVPEEDKENFKDGAESFEEKRGSLFKEVF